jgi:hypothetical protein
MEGGFWHEMISWMARAINSGGGASVIKVAHFCHVGCAQGR